MAGGIGFASLSGDPGQAPTATTGQQDAESGEPTSGPGEPTTDAGGQAPDDGDLAPEVATAHRELFTAIDTSEREMIALSQATAGSTEDLGEDELADFEASATEHVTELERIHDQLADLDTAGSEEVAATRDAYLGHLEDWIDWGRAVASDPTLVDRLEASGPYLEAINFSADGFATAVERNLDRDAAPDDVVDLADEILDRGFSGGDDGGTEI